MGHIVLWAGRTPDTRHGMRRMDPGQPHSHQLLPLRPGLSVSLSLVSGVITRVSHGQALVTSGHSHIRHEATGQLAEDETLKSIPFETGGSSMANESNIILLLSVYYRHTYGLLNACIAQAAVILDRGRESTRMELLSLTGLGPLDSGLLTLSALSRCHLISLNPLSVAQKLSPANTDY